MHKFPDCFGTMWEVELPVRFVLDEYVSLYLEIDDQITARTLSEHI